MKNANLFVALLGCCTVVGANVRDGLRESAIPHRRLGNYGKQNERRLANMMMPGERVSAMDKSSAICSANSMSDPGIAIETSVVNYYYAIESAEPISTEDPTGRSLISLLEDKIYRAIRPAILWCYFDESDDTQRKLSGDAGVYPDDNIRRLTVEEARRLSVVSFSTSPQDEEKSIKCNFPTQSGENCIVMHGMVTLMHHATSDVSLAIASIYDSTQKAMDFSEQFLPLNENENAVGVSNIEWLGETEEDAIGILVRIDEINTDELEQQEDDRSLLAYALSIPILLLILLALFASKNKKRKAKTIAQLSAMRSFDDVLIGTGDHPNSFHEGMYHYSPEGVRYLSTNCATCIETKRNGFFTAADLDTITERSVEEDDLSAHRAKFLVSASDRALGRKHSAIDVHNCSSARCPICTYQPRDVEFISKSEPFGGLRHGESEV